MRSGAAVGMLAAFAGVVLLYARALDIPYASDDLIGLGVLDDLPIGMSTIGNLYVLSTGEAADVAAAVADGRLPWWTTHDFKFAFARPLTSWLATSSHALFGPAPAVAHTHNIAWFLVLAVAAHAVFRRLLGVRAATFAVVILVLAPVHVLPVSWPAHRHSLIAAAFGWLGVLAHMRWREDGWGPGRYFAVLAFILGLAASEAGLMVVSLVLAFEVFGRRDDRGARVRSLAPYAALTPVYLDCYIALGFGVASTTGYTSPVADPVGFAVLARHRFGEVLLRLWAGGELVGGSLLLTTVAVALMAVPLTWRGTAQSRHLWLIVGGSVAIFATVGVPDANRYASVVFPAAAAVLAAAAAKGWDAARSPRFSVPRRTLGGLACAAVVCVHGILAAPRAWSAVEHRRAKVERSRTAIAALGPLEEATDALVVRRGRLWLGYGHQRFAADARRRWHVVSTAVAEHELERIDATRLVLSAGGRPLDRFGPPVARLSVGDVVTAAGVRYEVLAAERGAPTRVQLELPRAVDDGSWAIVTWTGTQYRREPIPAVGERVRI